MRLVTALEGTQWLASHGLPDFNADRPDVAQRHLYRLPSDGGRTTVLAGVLTRDAYRSSSGVVLAVLERGLRPGSENEPLFTEYRRYVAGEMDLDEYPYHIASRRDATGVEGLLALSLYFSWGVGLASRNGMALRLGQDHVLEILSDDVRTIGRLVDQFTMFALEPAKWDPDTSHRGDRHWDVDDGKGGRKQFDVNGDPVG